MRLVPFGSEGAAASCDLSRFEGSMTEQPGLCVCMLPEAGAQLVRGFVTLRLLRLCPHVK